MSKNNKYDNLLNNYVINEIEPNSKILDIGCWKGDLGNHLIKSKNCEVDGIDFNKQALNDAKRKGYQNTYYIDLNCDLSAFKEINFKKYDYIVFADVLEHLINANEILKITNSKVRKNTKIVISIPNIAFLKYRILHLFGSFNYTKTGVLDETHVKFYTKDTIIKLLKDNNFKIKSFVGYTLAGKTWWFVDYLAKLFETIFAIQFLIVCQKKEL